ncbi:MAG TPA: flagellar basal-body MS-ring/collar protein FliF [Xanthomonadaceae bacterium]|jgi:flagellar M-ring protein FliF
MNMSSIPKGTRLGLYAGIGAIVVLTAALIWWVMAPRQQVLFSHLREGDAAEIVQSLDAWKVPHEITDGGASITVPADQVYETRMRLVSAGVPKGGHVGFELFDNSDFGVTEFAQRVNYQRALQGEIERTIASLPAVEAVRVHLTIRKPGLFVGDQESSKASVALTLRTGETLSRQQINGIRSLVAAAVEGLSANAVSVIDSSGTLLAAATMAAPAADAEAGGEARNDEQARIEDRVKANVTQLLARVIPAEGFSVSVSATLDFDAVREVSEHPVGQGEDGNGLIARKRISSSDAADAAGKKQSQEETEYVHGTEHEEISRPPGRLVRLSVAVILPANFDAFQMDSIHSLVAAAAGIDSKRGDTLEVSRVSVSGERPVATMGIPAEPVATAPVVLDTTRLTGHSPFDGSREGWMKLLVVAGIVVLVLVILLVASRGRSGRLNPAERDAVLAKLRGWLAEGTTQP